MRQLPQQKNCEKAPRAGIDCSPSCCPANHWRDRARDGTNNRVRGAGSFQRRITEDVNYDRYRCECRAQSVASQRKIPNSKDREDQAECERFGRSHSARRHWSRSGPIHQRICLAFPPLIERGGPGSCSRCPKHDPKQFGIIDGRSRSQIKTDRGSQQHKRRQPRFD
jgi:hypothetical protein